MRRAGGVKKGVNTENTGVNVAHRGVNTSHYGAILDGGDERLKLPPHVLPDIYNSWVSKTDRERHLWEIF